MIELGPAPFVLRMDPLFKISLSPSEHDCSSDESDERTSFIRSAKSQRKYGSTTNRSCGMMSEALKSPTYVEYKVQPGDTLMGIALKHQTTVECIKRVNKMWNSDMLFLRETILVPSPDFQSEVNGTAILEASCCEMLPDGTDLMKLQPKVSHSVTPSDKNDTPTDQSLRDFLGGIDNQIQEAKSKAQKLQKTSDVLKDHPEFTSNRGSRRGSAASSRLRSSLSDLGGEFNAATSSTDSSVPNASIVGTRISNRSMFNHRARDEIFEL